jgi:hypothetical protein
MKDDKEKWMEDVFQSMKGSQRAKPRAELFANIKGEISGSKAKVVPMYQWRYAGVAAAFLIAVNTAVLLFYNQNNTTYEKVTVVDTYSQPLISTYQIYE